MEFSETGLIVIQDAEGLQMAAKLHSELTADSPSYATETAGIKGVKWYVLNIKDAKQTAIK